MQEKESLPPARNNFNRLTPFFGLTPKMLVICPTRGRAERIKKMLYAYEKNTSHKVTSIIFCIDSDDPDFEAYRKLFGESYAYYVFQGHFTMPRKVNSVATKACPGYEYYMFINDDHVIETMNYDVKLMNAIKEKGGGWGIAYGDDTIQGQNIPTHAVVSGNIVRVLRWLYLPCVQHMYGDDAWKMLGLGTERLFYLANVTIRHDHFIGENDTKEDATYKLTNTDEVYAKDKIKFDNWVKTKAREDICRIMAKIVKGCDKRVSLCMIVGDFEKSATLKRCLESVAENIEEICIVFNYKRFKNMRRVKKLLSVARECRYNIEPIVWSYEKWTNFSDMRNKSLNLATGDYCVYIDTDDVAVNFWLAKDYIMKYPDADYFKCDLQSFTEQGTTELILHNRLFKNRKGYEFRNNVHEDISFSMKEKNAKMQKAAILFQHLGNQNFKDVLKKNDRNIRLALKDYDENPHSLVYYALANAYIIKGKGCASPFELRIAKKFKPLEKAIIKRAREWYWKAIKLCDEYFEKFPESDIKWEDEKLRKESLKNRDPLTAKMWTLRGLACICSEQVAAAKQSFNKANEGDESPIAAVNLAECYMREEDYEQAIEVLMSVYEMKTHYVTNIAVNLEEMRILALRKLGDCWARIGIRDEDTQSYLKAEPFYRELMDYKMDLEVGDRMVQILNKSNRVGEAAQLTLLLVNKWPSYFNGWNNLGACELQQRRYVTARIFLERSLKINPRQKEARHNLSQILRAKIG